MTLVDTSIIVAWLDRNHDDHDKCRDALTAALGKGPCAVSSVTFAELAAGGRTREAVDEELEIFTRWELSFDEAWIAGMAFGRTYARKEKSGPVLPDFFIRAQAQARECMHLTNDHRRLAAFPQVEFVFA